MLSLSLYVSTLAVMPSNMVIHESTWLFTCETKASNGLNVCRSTKSQNAFHETNLPTHDGNEIAKSVVSNIE